MNITKCDICKKDTKGEYIVAGIGFFHNKIEACYACATPIVAFLKKHKVIKEEKKDV